MAKEYRIFTDPVNLVQRAEGEGESRTVEGYAFKFEVWSKRLYGYFREKIARGAQEGCDMSDVKAYFNHNPNLIVARKNANVNTLELVFDEVGLKYRFDAPNTTAGNDLVENLRIQLVQHSSFAFEVLEDKWAMDPEFEGGEIRTIVKFKLIDDVSPVVNPAYPDSTSYKRSTDQLIEQRKAELTKVSENTTAQLRAAEQRKRFLETENNRY